MLPLTLFFSLLLATPSVPAPAPARPVQTPGHQIVGTIVDFAGKPLAGATVELAGNRNSSVITNSLGKFLLPSPVPTPELRISFAGYHDTTAVVPSIGFPVRVEMRAVRRYKKQLKKQLKSAHKAWEKA